VPSTPLPPPSSAPIASPPSATATCWNSAGPATGSRPSSNTSGANATGIVNGIDTEAWDPARDTYLEHHFASADPEGWKRSNKEALCAIFGLDPRKPLFVFIGRLVGEKAADLLPQVIGDSLHHIGRRMSFLVLGSGEPDTEARLEALRDFGRSEYGLYLGYNEGLAHRLYAGADFLLMPSRVEPCGLNQLYALRYGTVPLVRNTGGLRDTVVDMGDENGFGIRFDQASVGDIVYSVGRALTLYEQDPDHLRWMQRHMMGFDHSWDRSAAQYLELYQSIL